MTPPATTNHPEHALEQAYIEKVHRANEKARSALERGPGAAGDRHAARIARQQMLDKFREPIDTESLCFGRIDLDGAKRFYLGRGVVHEEDSSNLLVVNWRAPIAKPFYTANRKDPQGLEARRRFQLDQLRLLGIVDEAFGDGMPPTATAPPAPPAVQGLPAAAPPPPEPAHLPAAEIALTPDSAEAIEPETTTEPEPHVVDAILADMDRARGREMRDIVATIEAQQYELISHPIDDLLVIQGGPGSGKTAIALHRAAWLLFNHDELERSGVLVVGPNRAFMEYVAQVLPSLGESTVTQQAIDRLPDLGDVRVRATEAPELARLKGDVRMARLVQRAVRARVRIPKDTVTVNIGRSRAALSPDRVRAAIDRSWRTGRTYLGGREAFRRELVRLAEQLLTGPRATFRSSPRAGEVEMAVAGTGGLFERIWPTVTAAEVLRDLYNSRQRMEGAAADDLAPEERALLQRERARTLREEPWTAADVPLLDEADAELRGATSTFGYVLADEAQDLSPMQLRMVLRRTSGNRATLVGDLAQATGPSRQPDWDDLLDASGVDADWQVAELAIGYRVPQQIMDLAAELLPRVAPQITVPRAVRRGPEDPRIVATDDAGLASDVVGEVKARIEGERSVAVVGPLDDLDALRAALIEAGVQAGDLLSDGLARQVTVLSAEQSKGLEFDHVIVVEPARIAGPTEDWAFVYIALTRATRTLAVVHTTPDPFEPMPPTDDAGPAEEPPPLVLDDAEVDPTPELATTLGPRYTEALMQAKFTHARQQRRGTFVPFFAHLQSVSALVLEDGGTEDEAIAALLHDAVEDYGPEVLERIVDQFGVIVARIVAGCTDPDERADETWRDRKMRHLRELETAGAEVRRVSLAEKLDNARALVRDYRRLGARLWLRMGVEAEDLLWYQSALADLFVTERPGDMASELQDTVERLLDLASAPEPAVS